MNTETKQHTTWSHLGGDLGGAVSGAQKVLRLINTLRIQLTSF